MVHQFVSNTATALDADRGAQGGRHGRRDAPSSAATSRDRASPLEGLRVLDLGTRIAAPFCAGLLGEHGRRGHQGRAARQRRLHARDRAVRADGDDGASYSLFWAVEGRGPQERHARPPARRGPGPVPPARRDRRRRRRELPARHARALEHRARAISTRSSSSCASAASARTARTRRGPASTASGIGYGGLLHLTGYPDRPPVRVGVTISDYLTGVFAAHAATAALCTHATHAVRVRAR